MPRAGRPENPHCRRTDRGGHVQKAGIIGQNRVRGRQSEDGQERVFLHRGIAARQFQRTFVLAEGMDVLGAELANGLLSVDLVRPEPSRLARRIDIVSRS